MRATLIAGLPGSGKTRLAADLAGAVPGAYVLDDPMSLVSLDTIPANAPLVVVTHPVFCRTEVRPKVEAELLERFPDAEISWIFFANEPDACRQNVRRRDDGRAVGGLITALSRAYEIPDGADLRPVYRPATTEPAQAAFRR